MAWLRKGSIMQRQTRHNVLIILLLLVFYFALYSS